MPPFIVTLSMSLVVGGVTLWLARSTNTPTVPDRFADIGFESFYGVPCALLIVFVLCVIVHVLLAKTLLGRWIYAVGHNAKTALISGVPVSRTTMAAYVVCGACTAVGSLLYTARLQTGSPTLGRDVFLDVIGAAVIGGASLFGGKGKVLWTVYGVLLFSLIDKTLDLLGLFFFTIMMVKGGVIVAAALLDVLRTRVLGGR
jgi:ribose transport system permease protein